MSLLDLAQQHPLLTLAYLWILCGSAMDAYNRRVNREQ